MTTRVCLFPTTKRGRVASGALSVRHKRQLLACIGIQMAESKNSRFSSKFNVNLWGFKHARNTKTFILLLFTKLGFFFF
jgi:hypothetical protein